MARLAAVAMSFSTTALAQESPVAPPAVKREAAGAAERVAEADSLVAKIVGEWEYRYNDRLWRRRFNPDGTIELWLEGKRDGTWLSDLRWKRVLTRGRKPTVGIFKGEERIAVLKLKDGAKELLWQDLPEKGGPKMQRIAPENFWSPPSPPQKP